MYNQSYEDYMRTVLGYNNPNRNFTYNQYDEGMNNNTNEINNLYPEIYRIVNPMVCKVCKENINSKINAELIENLSNTIYQNIEGSIETEQRREIKVDANKQPVRNEKETRQRRDNPFLKDLIKILIIKELLNQRKNVYPYNTNYVPNRPNPYQQFNYPSYPFVR